MRSNAGIAKQTKGRSPELFGRSVGHGLNAAFSCCINPTPVCLRTDACVTLNPNCLAVVLLSSRWTDYSSKGKGKVIPITGLCSPEGG